MPVRPVELRHQDSAPHGYTFLHARRSASLSSSRRNGAAAPESPRPCSAMSLPAGSPRAAGAHHAQSLTAAKSPSSPLAFRRAERVARDGLAACREARHRSVAPADTAKRSGPLSSASAGPAGSRRRSSALQAIAAAPITALHGTGASQYAEAFRASALAGQHSLGADTYVRRRHR